MEGLDIGVFHVQKEDFEVFQLARHRGELADLCSQNRSGALGLAIFPGPSQPRLVVVVEEEVKGLDDALVNGVASKRNSEAAKGARGPKGARALTSPSSRRGGKRGMM